MENLNSIDLIAPIYTAALVPHYPARLTKRVQVVSVLMKLVHEKVRTSELPHTKAAIILDTKPGAVEPVLRHFDRGAVSSFTKATSGRSS